MWIAEDNPAAGDSSLLSRANTEMRILTLLDLDFGELVFKYNLPAFGVMQLRVGATSAANILGRFQQAWPNLLPRLSGNFVVVTESKIRVQPLPVNNVKIPPKG